MSKKHVGTAQPVEGITTAITGPRRLIVHFETARLLGSVCIALLSIMANRDCNGKFFQITDKRYYKCLWDGSILNLDWFERPLGNGVECPNCKRAIDGSNAGDAVSFSQFKVYRFADGSSVVLD